MDFVKLAGTLPADEERNGLDEIASEVVKAPRTLRAVILLVDCKQVIEKTDTGDNVAMLRVRRAEVLTGKDAEAGHRLFRKAMEKRLGHQLPISVDEELESGFGGEQP